MDTSDRPAATIHPGAVRAIFDHLILSLTADGTPGDPVFLFSHYRFRWAADGIVGDLAFVELERGGGPERILVTSEPALAEAQAARLSPRGWAEVDVARSPMVAAFRGTPLAGSDRGRDRHRQRPAARGRLVRALGSGLRDRSRAARARPRTSSAC